MLWPVRSDNISGRLMTLSVLLRAAVCLKVGPVMSALVWSLFKILVS